MSAAHALRSAPVVAVAACVALAAALPRLAPNLYYVHVGNLACINLLFVVSLAIIARAGQLSFAHAGFALLGGYVSALLTTRFGWPPLAGLAAAAAISAVAAALLGWVILRVQGVYFVLITFSFGQILSLLALDWSDLTGGANGIVGIPPLALFGKPLIGKADVYPLTLGCALATLAFAWTLYRTPFGDAMAATAHNKRLADSSGVDTHRTQVVAFTIGSCIAGFTGALSTHYFRFISPDSFTFWDSVSYLTMLVVGGRVGVLGSVLGALVLTPLPELLRDALQYQQIIYGVVLVVCLMFLPQGLASLRGRWRRAAPGGAPVVAEARS